MTLSANAWFAGTLAVGEDHSLRADEVGCRVSLEAEWPVIRVAAVGGTRIGLPDAVTVGAD